jgi:hypothetical protein
MQERAQTPRKKSNRINFIQPVILQGRPSRFHPGKDMYVCMYIYTYTICTPSTRVDQADSAHATKAPVRVRGGDSVRLKRPYLSLSLTLSLSLSLSHTHTRTHIHAQYISLHPYLVRRDGDGGGLCPKLLRIDEVSATNMLLAITMLIPACRLFTALYIQMNVFRFLPPDPKYTYIHELNIYIYIYI